MKTAQTLLDPQILGFWIRCIRETQHMSQEAVGASSGLDVRTIQRIEAGNPVSITTRRCLARGLGYENPDIFDDPEFAKNVLSFLEGALTPSGPRLCIAAFETTLICAGVRSNPYPASSQLPSARKASISPTNFAQAGSSASSMWFSLSSCTNRAFGIEAARRRPWSNGAILSCLQ
jgi:transcriptional regulator with XRE-family HTH domain